MNTTVVIVGAMIATAAIVGGALKGWNIEFPPVTGKAPRLGLAILGASLILLGSMPAIINQVRGERSEVPKSATGDPAATVQPSVFDDIAPSTSPPGLTWLADMTPVAYEDGIGESTQWTTEPVQVKGTTYDKALSAQEIWCDWTEVDYVLAGRYQRFEATVGIADDSPETEPLDFYVLTDENPAKTIQDVAVGELRTVDLPVKGVTRLSIGIDIEQTGNQCPETVGVWIDPRVIP